MQKIKWIGMYSYLTEKYYEIKYLGNEDLIKEFIAKHKIIVGFNNLDFDDPIMCNNNAFPEKGYRNSVDIMKILGTGVGSFKNRGKLMDYKFKETVLK